MSRIVRRLDFMHELDPQHPTRINVLERPQDYSGERTDKRTSECYVVVGLNHQGETSHPGGTLEFHEGCHPRDALNGFLLEDLLAICLDRLDQHQSGPFKCEENGRARDSVAEALDHMASRRKRRQDEGTSGTQLVSEREG